MSAGRAKPIDVRIRHPAVDAHRWIISKSPIRFLRILLFVPALGGGAGLLLALVRRASLEADALFVPFLVSLATLVTILVLASLAYVIRAMPRGVSLTPEELGLRLWGGRTTLLKRDDHLFVAKVRMGVGHLMVRSRKGKERHYIVDRAIAEQLERLLPPPKGA